MISIGGSNDGLGYFGWVIASSSTILVEGYGHAPGHPNLMESLRSKAYGCLTPLLFLKHCRIHHDITAYLSKQYYFCDNITLIKRLKDYQK
eukprot:302438-Ditylum_brightwellii.AAC.1